MASIKIESKPIRKLDQKVIDKISAGEVVHRPVNVVKELMENSLDAGATKIDVSVNNGGLTTIIISDNGCGIRKDDLPIACQRHTTSKLIEFNDVYNLTSFGFRGEALASVSAMAKVSIISRTADEQSGYRAIYEDGICASIKPETKTQGTEIVVDDLFYNFVSRRLKLGNSSKETSLIRDMLIKYAIFYSDKCRFIFRKLNGNNEPPMINTTETKTMLENICTFYGHNLKHSLIPFSTENERLKFKAKGFFSDADLNLKSMNFILFINSRLVECAELKKAIRTVYIDRLMKGGHPFVIIMLDIAPKNIEVNIHPTKSQVQFLHQDEIIEELIELLQQTITTDSVSLLDQTKQSQLNSSLFLKPFSQAKENSASTSSLLPFLQTRDGSQKSVTPTTLPSKPRKFVRIDTYKQRIDQYLMNRQKTTKKYRNISYKSVQELREEIFQDIDEDLMQILVKSEFVGCVNEKYATMQSGGTLFLLNLEKFNRQLFYQVYLLYLGNFDYFRFGKPLALVDLLREGFSRNNTDKGVEQQSMEAEALDKYIDLLVANSEMLEDLISIKINPVEKVIEAMPVLIEHHVPSWQFLPEFIYNLAVSELWQYENDCLQMIGNELAQFYSRPAMTNANNDQWSSFVEFKAYPLYKTTLLPTCSLRAQKAIQSVVNAQNLYKVFERCD